MSTADKLLTVAQNVEKVYNAGLEKGKSQGGNVPKWAQNLDIAKFKTDAWADEETVIDIPALSSISEIFQNVQFTKIKKLTIKSDTPIKGASYAFLAPMGGTAFLETLVLDCDFSQCTLFDTWLMRQQKLKRIEGQPFNLSGATRLSSFAPYAYAVEYFRVVPETIMVSFAIEHWSKLDEGTIQSVIDGLADMTGGDAKTLALHADVKAKLTETQLATITGKNWTIA